MANTAKLFEIRDMRNGSWFWVQTHLWRDRTLSKADKLVYGTLASYANMQQESFPGADRVADDAGVSERQVYYSIKVLEGRGYVGVERRRGKPNIYSLLKTTPATIAPLQNMHQGGAKSTVGTPAKSAVLTKYNITKTNTRGAAANPLVFSRSRMTYILKEFPGLTFDLVRDQAEKCNNYMAMSSDEYKNPGLFFRGWMRKFYVEWKKQKAQEDRDREFTANHKPISEEQLARNRERIAEIKSKLLTKSI
jgi:hypothetical protein